MESIKRFLIDLDSVKAAYLFLVALLAASFSIVFDVGLPAIPIAVVLAYGCVLLAASHWYVVPHGEMTKNSPYFLGFLLFLVALYSIFRETSGDFRQAKILPRLAAALLPTIIGLSIRQFLFATDPAQRDHDAFYRTLEEELKHNAVEFKKAQIQLVELVRDFTNARQTLLAAEEKTAQDYVDHMRKAVAIFEESASAYPKAILDAITALNKRLTTVVQKLDHTVEIAGTLDLNAVANASTALRSLSSELTDARNQLTALGTGVQATTSNLSGVASMLEETVKKTQITVEQFTEVFLNGIADALTKLRLAIESEHLSISKTAKPIVDDLQAIDRILTDFAKLLESKVLAVGSGKFE
jgi:hypothetical protein